MVSTSIASCTGDIFYLFTCYEGELAVKKVYNQDDYYTQLKREM